MNRNFINRKEELSFLEERFKNNNFEFIIIYGRRRIGKTELIKQFITKKESIYFLSDKKGTENNIERFKKTISEFFKEPIIAANDIEEIFDYISKKNKRIVIVFDEFSYLVEQDSTITSAFQRAIDNILQKSKIMLILCGSSLSLMESLISYKNPLYGRKTGHWKVLPMDLAEINEFYPNYKINEIIEIYSVLGGIPFYLEKFNDNLSVIKNIENEILNKKGRLYEEIDFLLKQELRVPDVYKNILEAISKGKRRTIEISDYTKIKVNDLDRYLKVLIQLGIIKKENPILEKKSKKTQYLFSDNFFNFWFKFCEPFKSNLEINELELIKKNLAKNFNSYVSEKYEELCKKIIKNYKYNLVGKWWGHYRTNDQRKEIEIDIVAINEEKKEILFGECKWQSNVNPIPIIQELKEKSKYVQWNNEKRKEKYAVFAKSFKKEFKNKLKENQKETNILLFDLEEIEKVIKD